MGDQPQTAVRPADLASDAGLHDAPTHPAGVQVYDRVAPRLPRLSTLVARLATAGPVLASGLLETSTWGAGRGCGS